MKNTLNDSYKKDKIFNNLREDTNSLEELFIHPEAKWGCVSYLAYKIQVCPQDIGLRLYLMGEYL